MSIYLKLLKRAVGYSKKKYSYIVRDIIQESTGYEVKILNSIDLHEKTIARFNELKKHFNYKGTEWKK